MTSEHPHAELLDNIRGHMPALEKSLEFANSEWVGEDLVYRFWHGSMKVYSLQAVTLQMYENLVALTPSKGSINPDFLNIVTLGTGKVFSMAANDDWVNVTKPIVDAFFHTKYMLSIAVKYGKILEEAPWTLPSGWAALLHLYSIR